MISNKAKNHTKLDVEGHDLSNQKYKGLNINISNLYSTNWYNSQIEDSVFRSCNFQYSKLSKLILKNSKMKKCDFRGADFSGSCLKSVDLSGSNFWECSLSNTKLEDVYLMDVIGNGKEIKSFQIGLYTITYTFDKLQVGCKIHPIDQWDKFENRDLLEMGGREAAKFWMLYKDSILSIIALSPAVQPMGS